MAGSARRAQPKPAEGSNFSQWKAWTDIKNKPTNPAGQSTGAASSGRTASGSRPTPTPPAVPPRNVPHHSPQKQPKGSFGARVQKNGYIPESPGDEGAHSKDNYFTTRTHSSLFSETSTAAKARRRAPPSPPTKAEDDNDESAFAEERHSTPYQTQGGERFDPWNGASNIGRSRSTRQRNGESNSNDDEQNTPNANGRQRSSSIPNVADNLPQGAQNRNGQRAASTTPASGGYQKSPKDGEAGHGENNQLYAKSVSFSSTVPTKEPLKTVPRSPKRAACDEDSHNKTSLNHPPTCKEMLSQLKSSSEDKPPAAGYTLNGFEKSMRSILQGLANNKYGTREAIIESVRKAQRAEQQSKNGANSAINNSFGSHARTPTDTHRFTRNSTDNINTRFVAAEDANYQFSAGSPVAEDGRPAMPRSKSGSRVGRSPFGPQAAQNPFNQPPSTNSAQDGSFDPAEWAEKIDPSFFEAQTPQKNPAPAGRPMRKSSKKPVRMTAGTAGMVDPDESSSGQEDVNRTPTGSGRASGDGVNGTTGPTPMDLDLDDGPKDLHSDLHNAADNGVRNIPVTPSRPEWRAGDVGLGIKVDAKPAGAHQAQFAAPVGGSEDTEEFKASFADLRNLEPFADRPTGLESFGDMRTNLPFQSAAAGQAPIRKPVVQKSHNLTLPVPPKPPASPPALGPNLGLKPSAVSWKKYVEDFAQYMQEWHKFDTKFIDHFAARKLLVQSKLNNLDWIASRNDAGLAEYMRWEDEDHAVRDQWMAACNSHEIHMRTFNGNRQKMMQ